MAQTDLLTKEEIFAIFSDMELFGALNTQFYKELEERLSGWPFQVVGDIFVKSAPLFHIYSRYIVNYDRAMETLKHCTDKSVLLKEFLDVRNLSRGIFKG